MDGRMYAHVFQTLCSIKWRCHCPRSSLPMTKSEIAVCHENGGYRQLTKICITHGQVRMVADIIGLHTQGRRTPLSMDGGERVQVSLTYKKTGRKKKKKKSRTKPARLPTPPTAAEVVIHLCTNRKTNKTNKQKREEEIT